LLRASQSIPLTIAEGNGKGTNADRRRHFEIARGSALECASILDCLKACEVLTVAQDKQGKTMLIRIASKLTKLGRRDHEIRETAVFYGDYDNDNDNDNESNDSGSES
jgi:four helix bundle protein